MAFNIEQSTCTGRGFSATNADGLLANFKNWVIRTPVASPSATVSGGPGWYIIDDQSDTSVDPSPNKVAWLKTDDNGLGTSFDTLAEISAVSDGEFQISIGGVSRGVSALDFSSITTWDEVADVIQTGIQSVSSSPGDGFDGAIVKHFRKLYVNNPFYNSQTLEDRFIIVAGAANKDVSYLTNPSLGGTYIGGAAYLDMESGAGIKNDISVDPYIVVSDQQNPTTYSGAKFVEIGMVTGTAGQIYIKTWMNYDTTIHTGFGMFGAHSLGTVDAGAFVYDFRGGDECIVIQTRVGTAWSTYILDEWLTDLNLVEAATISGTLSAAANDGDSTIYLNTGEGSNFTDDNFYFLYNLNRSEAIDYLQVTATAGDTLSLNETLTKRHSSGSLLSPYYQRFHVLGTNILTGVNNYVRMGIPVRSVRQKEFGVHATDDFCYSRIGGHVLEQLIKDSAPNDEGKYIVMKPVVGEYDSNSSPNAEGNRSYGQAKNLYYTAVGSMSQMLNGKTIVSKEWVYFHATQHPTTYTTIDIIVNDAQIGMMVPNYNEV